MRQLNLQYECVVIIINSVNINIIVLKSDWFEMIFNIKDKKRIKCVTVSTTLHTRSILREEKTTYPISII